jgi:hypothetical protein
VATNSYFNGPAELGGCRACGKQVAKAAMTCPHCGITYPAKESLGLMMKTGTKIALAAMLIPLGFISLALTALAVFLFVLFRFLS